MISKDDLINKLKYISNNPLINGEYDEENYLFDDEAKLLLDYITNLQNENERLKNIIDTFEEELERESNIKEEQVKLEHNTFIDINNTLKTALRRFKELKGDNK